MPHNKRKNTSSSHRPRKAKRHVPKLRHHKASGQGFVEIDKRRHYLGVYGKPETEQAYHRLIAEWIANGRRLPVDPRQITMVELVQRFWAWAKTYYGRTDGAVTRELDNYRSALRPVRRLYGNAKAVDFGPVALKTVRHELGTTGCSRQYVNRQISRIKRMFRWAVSEELIPAQVYQALAAVEGLRYGRGGLPETAPVQPVPQEEIEAVKPHVSRQVWALIQLQLLTAARPGELLPLRAIDLDMSGEVWTYTLMSHKTAHHGHKRIILFGPRAQAILRPWLAGRPVDQPLFSPREADAERRTKLHAERSTPLSCGNRPGTNRRAAPKKQPGEAYTTVSYARAIAYACQKAHPAPDGLSDEKKRMWHREHRWTPHRLRHTAATRIRKEHGLEAAQVILGHRHAQVTEVYAERDQTKALHVARMVG